jgi:hypothetical protein
MAWVLAGKRAAERRGIDADDELLGVDVAMESAPLSLNALGYAFMASENLGQMYTRVARYAHVVTDACEITFTTESHGGGRLSISGDQPLLAGADARTVWSLFDYAMVSVVRGSRLLYGRDFAPLELRLQRPRPQSPARYEKLLGCQPVYGCPDNAVLLDAATLKRPLAFANQEVARASEEAVERHHARQHSRWRREQARAAGDPSPPGADAPGGRAALGQRGGVPARIRRGQRLHPGLQALGRSLAQGMAQPDRPGDRQRHAALMCTATAVLGEAIRICTDSRIGRCAGCSGLAHNGASRPAVCRVPHRQVEPDMPDADTSLDRRQWMALSLGAPALGALSLGGLGFPTAAQAQSTVKVDGFDVPTTSTVRGKKLVLNGAGVRRRGYYKSNIVALYLPERLTTMDAIMKLDGPRRIQMLLLRDFSQSTVSRIFLADFKQAATDTEFKTLINEVAEIGAIYNNVKRVEQGDKVNIDWQPGAGIIASLNDRQLNEKPINSELGYQIYLRMFLGATVPEDLRNRLLGLSNAA